MLKQKIQQNLEKYLRENKMVEVAVLRMLKTAITNKEKQKRAKLFLAEGEKLEEKEIIEKSALSDEEIMEIISSEIKNQKQTISKISTYQESISVSQKNKIKNFIEKEKREVEILEKYLPKQLSEKEIKNLVWEVIKKTGAKELKEIGKVMADIMPKVKGKAEGSVVSKIVQELLTSSVKEK